MAKGKLFVISGPSGAGKGTICKEILDQERNIELSVSMTTRQPRQGEIDKVHYHFVTKNDFDQLNIQVQNELDNITKSLKQVDANTKGVQQAEKAHGIMQESFKIGSGTFLQLRDTEDALMSARLSYYQSIYNYLVAESDLEFVLGNAPIYKYTSTK